MGGTASVIVTQYGRRVRCLAVIGTLAVSVYPVTSVTLLYDAASFTNETIMYLDTSSDPETPNTSVV